MTSSASVLLQIQRKLAHTRRSLLLYKVQLRDCVGLPALARSRLVVIQRCVACMASSFSKSHRSPP